jgi:hypothetical protein
VGFVLGISAQRLCTGVGVGEVQLKAGGGEKQENVIRERAIVDKGRGNETGKGLIARKRVQRWIDLDTTNVAK